ncbi:MAG: hypothetical protein JNM59_04115 [Hyphomonadaceae bacterium]|nr:hypothetical protein [Hyphomonadaceae bacterium]
MRSKGGKTIKLNPVDEDHQVHDHPARAGLEAIMDQKLFSQRIKSERAAAYWFAASLWGVTGLALGAILGVFVTLMVQTGSAPIWRENVIAGAAMDEARDSVNQRDPILPSENRP